MLHSNAIGIAERKRELQAALRSAGLTEHDGYLTAVDDPNHTPLLSCNTCIAFVRTGQPTLSQIVNKASRVWAVVLNFKSVLDAIPDDLD